MDETTQRFIRIEEIFNEALAAPDQERAEVIETRCAGNAALATEVHSLLEACAAEEQLTASWRLRTGAGQSDLPSRRHVGPYEIDRLLGRGGMGAVYLAHRDDGNFEQQVAIKLIDLPLTTDLFRERFRQERQILAGLQHPYIARLMDGGVTAEGDLYLAMEYVDGVPIHRFCAEHNLSVPERLALFLHVCEAVQFAHQNFVVHRDLKPDNILVAKDSTPRLLDFGTAKLISSSHSKPEIELTREGYLSFTPQYASPEQVLGTPITTASDTYSLGVLLYLLLTGSPPYEIEELTTAEMLRKVCVEAPRRPTVAAGCGGRFDPDLEAILLKALRKEPQERYLTAEQLASDLRAHIEGRPVAARRGTVRYRAAKFIRRHRFGLLGAALLAATLFTGIAGILWQSRVANLERRKAEARSADLRQLSNSLLSELNEAIKQLPGSTGAQHLLVTRVLEHLDRMAKDAQGDRQTQLDLVDAYTQLGEIQGDPYVQNLGDPAGALASLDKAVAMAAPLAPEGSANGSKDREALLAMGNAQEVRSEILFGIARTQEAIVSMQAATRALDRLIAAPPVTPTQICEASTAYGSLGDELGQSGTASLGDTAGALAAFHNSLALDERALGIDPNFLRAKRGLSINRLKIGSVELETDPTQALKDFQMALKSADALPKAEQGSLSMVRIRAMLLRKEANAMVALGEFDEAAPLFAQVVQIQQHLAAADPLDSRALADLEVVLDDEALAFEEAANPVLASAYGKRRQNLAAAEKLLTQTVAIMERMLKQDPSNENWRAGLADGQVRLATIRSALHSAADSNALAKNGIAALRQMANKDTVSPMILDQAANAFLSIEPASLRDPQSAISCAERAAALSHRKRPHLLLTLAQAYRASGQIEKSAATANEALALLSVLQPGSVKPNILKLLEVQMQTSR